MRKIIAEWIPYMSAYRLYDPAHPEQTIAYEDSEDALRQREVEDGYEITIMS